MSDEVAQGVTDEPAGQTGGTVGLDPFAYLPGVASKIVGLGGNAPGHDSGYVFHTSYVPVGRGQATFTARFAGLRSKRGTLFLTVHMLSTESGAQVRLVATERILMNRLVARQGEASISFESFDDVHYALLGTIVDVTDAEAEGLTVTLDLSQEDAEYTGPPIEARNTAYGSNALRPRAHLVALEPATLAAPVSQACTPAQFAERAYRDWAERLDLGTVGSRRQWTFAYILQVLRQYGMLEPGACGVGFGVSDEPLPAFLAKTGVSAVAPHRVRQHDGPAGGLGTPLDRRRAPAMIDDAAFDQLVSFHPADPGAIPRELVNFDFTWSTDAASRLGSIAAGLGFLRNSIRCLRPGGLAVHVFDFDLSHRGSIIETPAISLLRRNDVEQIALDLISRGHEVAQIKVEAGRLPWRQHVDLPGGSPAEILDATAGIPNTAFGIVVRRSPGL